VIGATLRDRVAAIVRAELAKLGILTFHEHRVVLQAGPFVELQAVRKAAGLPDLARTVARPGAAGYSAAYKPGSLVLVGFVEGKATRPFIAFGGEVGGPGTVPLEATIDATETTTIGSSSSDVLLAEGAAAVLRVGDTISISPGNGSGPVAGVVTFSGPSLPDSGHSRGKGMTDFGHDLSCMADLDPAMGEVEGLEGLEQAAYRRLTTPRRQLLGDEFYGIDVRDFLSAEVPDLAQIPATIEAELRKEERILGVTTVATWDAKTSKLRLVITCEAAEGPFSMTLDVTDVSVALLAGGA